MIISVSAWKKVSSSDVWIGIIDVVFFDCPENYLMWKVPIGKIGNNKIRPQLQAIS